MKKPTPIAVLETPHADELEGTDDMLATFAAWGYALVIMHGPRERLRILSTEKLNRRERARVLAHLDAVVKRCAQAYPTRKNTDAHTRAQLPPVDQPHPAP